MSQGSQLWQNERMKAFFRAHIRRETALDEKSAEKLVEALAKAVNYMRVWSIPDETPQPEAAKTKGAPDAKTDTAFDPYAFSAMVVLTKTGREGLAKKLAEIKGADNLRKFAEAQHLGIDRKLTRIDDLRKAILSAAEQRLADRRAAAS
jgi:hypothetical protein